MTQILLVEDNDNQRSLYEESFLDEGYDILSAANGKSALSLFRKHRPTLVILDILLPDIDGITVMERMLEIDPNQLIIIHSAYSSPVNDFVTSFAQAYVMKSGNLEALTTIVRQFLPVALAQSTGKS